MRSSRFKWLLLLPVVSFAIAHFDRAANLSPGNWREASREPVGLAPDPAEHAEAVAQVYAARAVRWRGYFGVHTWIAVKPRDASAYKVYEVTRWNRRRNGSMVSVSDRIPDGRWYGNAPILLADLRGPAVEALIGRIDAAVEAYPYTDEYQVWPGPNSNTFTAWVLREVPELRVDLPPTAIGKDFLGQRFVARSPSGTGGQLSVFGLLGVTAGLEEGLEINVLGFHFGIDPLDLALRLPFAGNFGLLGGQAAEAAEPEESATEPSRRYTFSWPYSESSLMQPRGGTSIGPEVTLHAGPTDAWLGLQEPGLSKFERDRRAILAMAGEYRTSFDFIETVGFTPGFEPGQPYQSWATERIDVIEDSGDRIVLQHVIVMRYVDADGNVQGPVVQKHWRQDWVYEDMSLHEFSGHSSWTAQERSPAEVSGRWSQAVYQVDDSPRYEALGDWVHRGNYSAWTSAETWRPLPRRESSVRDDYHVLIGTNRHTITPTGWVHEEENLKVVLDPSGAIAADQAILSRELGVNRYEQVVDFDFSARDDYWEATAAFWADVREEWTRIYAERERFELTAPPGEPPLFMPMFIYAAELEAGQPYDAAAGRLFIRETLARYVN
ncbi:MAG TPA: DUF3750 domain-containing protein [Gammaproteobacteria bacterium]|jgi:hypothetical protein